MFELTPIRCFPTDTCLPELLSLIQCAFASMGGRIDPPSSMHELAVKDIAAHCLHGEVWAIGTPPVACIFLKPRGDALYLSKLAVAADLRGQGIARLLTNLARTRALAIGLSALELDAWVELVENHSAFQKLGFFIVHEGRHNGYPKPTFFTMRQNISADSAI